jgi:hypothetical protein
MKLSSRETFMLWITLFTILFAVSYWYMEPKIENIREFKKAQRSLKEEIELYKKIVARKPEAEKRLSEVRSKLSSYPPDQDVTADYMKVLERLVKEHDVTLIQRKPQKEKRQSNLYELAIDCTWEAELNSLIKFLHAMSKEQMTMEIKDITISLIGAGKSRLKGNFTLLCLYTREGEPAKESYNKKEETKESATNSSIILPINSNQPETNLIQTSNNIQKVTNQLSPSINQKHASSNANTTTTGTTATIRNIPNHYFRKTMRSEKR